ncbi:DciA family protein [Chelativorans sp. SCAU2101]|jgi:Uncharacterized protein conserved in bacteria|uniref:DciA family protein n=1 Tax=Chelativorans petroleitrophicus TaxID=2975484 RepID=A0A9X2XB09_9HYPH|nr:DciA family protein [Chelativorans petroleitrophicus]MCT8991456.1 DciA family protein [Chelativorans petroleitrophicus]
MTGKSGGHNPVPVSDLASEILDPVLRRRAGLSVALVQSWPEIVGERLADRTQPEKIAWPRRRSEDEPFEPATLVIACEGPAALYVQHETAEIISRANSFLGFAAIGRIKIVQKPVARRPAERPKSVRTLSQDERERLDRLTEGIEEEGLRDSLKRLGESLLASRRKPPLADS